MCTARHNGTKKDDGAGIYAASGNRIEENVVSDNDVGIRVASGPNFIARNRARGNTQNWSVASGNVCLVVTATKTTGAISGDAGGVAPGSTDPNANFTY